MCAYLPRLTNGEHVVASRWANAAPKVPLFFSLFLPLLNLVARRAFETEFPREWSMARGFPVSYPEIPIYLTLETIDDQGIKFVSIDCEFVLFRASFQKIESPYIFSGHFVHFFALRGLLCQLWDECTKDYSLFINEAMKNSLIFHERSLRIRISENTPLQI